MKTKRIYVYCIYFPTSDKYYIGQTDDLKRRLLYQHLENSSNNLIGNALQKYDDWQVTILHICKSRDEANKLEIDHIRNFNSIIPNGYNITRGGSDSNGFEGYKHTEEAKRKIGDACKKNLPGKGNKNKPKSESHRKSISKAKLGTHWKVSEEGRKNMSKARRGNKNAVGNKHSKEADKRKSNEMKRNNPSCRVDVKIKKLKHHIARLEDELESGIK